LLSRGARPSRRGPNSSGTAARHEGQVQSTDRCAAASPGRPGDRHRRVAATCRRNNLDETGDRQMTSATATHLPTRPSRLTLSSALILVLMGGLLLLPGATVFAAPVKPGFTGQRDPPHSGAAATRAPTRRVRTPAAKSTRQASLRSRSTRFRPAWGQRGR